MALEDYFRTTASPAGYEYRGTPGYEIKNPDNSWRSIGSAEHSESLGYINNALANPQAEQIFKLAYDNPGGMNSEQKAFMRDPIMGLDSLGQGSRWGDVDLFSPGMTGQQAGALMYDPNNLAYMASGDKSAGTAFLSENSADAQARKNKKGGMFGGGIAGLALMAALAYMTGGASLGAEAGIAGAGMSGLGAAEATSLAGSYVAGGEGALGLSGGALGGMEAIDSGVANYGATPNELAGNAFEYSTNPGESSGNLPGQQVAQDVPVEDRSKLFNPKTSGGMPDMSNLARFVMKNGMNMGGKGMTPDGGSASGGLPWNMISGGMNIGSGILGLLQKKKSQDIANMAFDRYKNMGDPYAMVRELMANPGSVTGQPGYQFGLDEGRRAIARTGAAGGSGGNEAIALARYTPEYAQNFYNNEIARRMALGGGEAQVGTAGAGIGLNAQMNADRLMSSSLGSIGYGATRMAGMPQGNDMMMKMLMSAFS